MKDSNEALHNGNGNGRESVHKQEVHFENTPLPDIIELSDVWQTYDKEKSWVIADLNLLIEDKPDQGQFVVVLGTSGCGKSTILRYISGLQDPTAGEIKIWGKSRRQDDPIAMVFQQYSSFPWYSVLDNVMLPLKFKGVPKKQAREAAMEMINKVGLSGHEKKFAQYPILSGGQLQRVAIARSLAANPKILLMDEPFGALDIHTRQEMQDLLADLWLSMQSTIIFVTHDIREAVYLGDDIHVMRSSPGQIEKSFRVDLPLERNRETRRDTRFNVLVDEVEDYILSLNQQIKK
jgi:NitT/TauT family transport system ATP-binding protein